MKARFLSLTLGLITTLALLVGSGATAANAQPSSLAVVPGTCSSGCFLHNLWLGGGGVFISGHVHGDHLLSGDAGTLYIYTPKDGSWGWMRSVASGLCWNQAGNNVYLDSCV